MTWCKHFIVGCSVGLGSYPSTIAVLEQQSYHELDGSSEVKRLLLGHLERLPADASYSQLSKYLRDIRDDLKGKEQGDGGVDFLADITEAGSSVIKFFAKEDLKPIQVTIAGGEGVLEIDYQKWRIAKRELISPLQVLMQEKDKIRIGTELALAPALKEELSNFRVRARPRTVDDIEAWREGKSDDLVIATALAAWWADRHIAQPKTARDAAWEKVLKQDTSWIT